MHAWKCMSIWYAIVITSWAQPNPNLPAHKQFNIYNTHLNAWKYSYNAHGMQWMKNLKHFHKNQPKNFVKNSTILKNPKFSTKTQKVRSKHVMHEEWVKKRHTRCKESIQRPKNTWVGGLEWEREILGGEETRIDRERLSKMKSELRYTLI